MAFFYEELELVFDSIFKFTILIVFILLTYQIYLNLKNKTKKIAEKSENNILTNKILPIESIFSNNGGSIDKESSPLRLIVEPDTVKMPTKFSIKESKIEMNIPFKCEKQTPFLELEPHSVDFNVPVTLEMIVKDVLQNVCLFKQDNNENDKVLNKWLVKFPEKSEKNNNLLFKLNSFSFGFIGQMNMGIDANCKDIPCVEFNQKFKPYQFIYPGLNYRIVCENLACVGNKELIIIKRGFGEFQPNNDIDQNEYLRTIKCPNCDLLIKKPSSIKMMILFQSKGTIKFKINKKGEKLQTSDFDVNGNNMVLFGDENKNVEYTSLILSVNQSLSFKSGTNKDLVAGVTEETFKKIKDANNLPGGQTLPVQAFTTRLVENKAKFGIPHVVLKWDLPTDLDLHVIEPNGEEIFCFTPKSTSGGELDIDMTHQRNAIENIFWKTNGDQLTAPKGLYKIYVNYFDKHVDDNVVRFEVAVMENKNSAWKYFPGQVTYKGEKKLIHQFYLNY